MSSQLSPEPASEDLSRFLVEGPLAVKAVVSDLLRGNAEVRIFAAADTTRSFVSRLVQLDARGLHLEFKAGEQQAEWLSDTGIIVVGFMGSVKIQFACPHPFPGRTEGIEVLTSALPSGAYRIQRREAFRVTPPLRRPIECVVRPVQGSETRYKVHDVSVSGLGLIGSQSGPPVIAGEIWRNCRLEIPAYAPIAFDLVIRSVKPDTQDNRTGSRIGCEFHRPSVDAQRSIQIYVMDIERTQRSRGPALAR